MNPRCNDYNKLYMNFSKLRKVLGIAAGGLASSTVLASPSPPIYQIIRGQYEDKIRRYSPPQKIFQVFAKLDDSSRCTMRLHQMLRAICFYNYSQSNDQNLSNFMSKFIPILLGKSNHFDIYDYFNLVRFITFGREKMRQYFQGNNIQKMNKDQFVEFILLTVCKDYDQFIREPIYIESRQFAPRKEEYLSAVKRMADSLFSHQASFSYDQLIDFRLDIMKEVYAFQFRTFKSQNGMIDGVDFARSIIKYAENNHKRLFLRRISQIQPEIQDVRISEAEYIDFHVELRVKHSALQRALTQKGAMNFKQVLKLFNEHSSKLNEQEMKIFFRLLDIDDSDFIEKKQVCGVISQLGYYWQMKPGQNSVTEIARKRLESFSQKSKRILDILLEE